MLIPKSKPHYILPEWFKQTSRRTPCFHVYVSVCACVCVLGCCSSVQLFVTLWTVACQASLSMWVSKTEGVGFHSFLQGIILTQGLNPHLLHLLQWEASSLSLVSPGKPLVFTPWTRSWLSTQTVKAYFKCN